VTRRSKTVVEPKRFFTVDEVAANLRVSRMTVYRLVESTEIGSVRIGRSIRIPAQAMAAYLASHGRPRRRSGRGFWDTFELVCKVIVITVVILLLLAWDWYWIVVVAW
jgi:excisionase family DNA binding protein